MTVQTDPPRKARPRRLIVVAAAACVAGLAALAAVYGMGGTGRNDATCNAALATARRMAPFSRGEVAAVAVATEGRRVPDLAFRDSEGKERTLGDFKGRVVLLNLWATWCVPCRKEMPSLDALQAKLGGTDFQVVAVNIDTRDPEKPKTWLKDVGITRLPYYADPSAKVFQDLKAVGRAFGMPTTLVIDPAGCELGTIAGPAEWASDDAVKLVEAALGKTPL
jgi:thiol-disulfide isomerase/thioredoxin